MPEGEEQLRTIHGIDIIKVDGEFSYQGSTMIVGKSRIAQRTAKSPIEAAELHAKQGERIDWMSKSGEFIIDFKPHKKTPFSQWRFESTDGYVSPRRVVVGHAGDEQADKYDYTVSWKNGGEVDPTIIIDPGRGNGGGEDGGEGGDEG